MPERIWSKEKVIETYQKLHKELGRLPRTKDILEHIGFHWAIYEYFGGLNEVRTALSLPTFLKGEVYDYNSDFEAVTVDLGYIIGVLLGDGCLYHRERGNFAIIHVSVDLEFVERFKFTFERQFKREAKILKIKGVEFVNPQGKKYTRKDHYRYVIYSKKIFEFLKLKTSDLTWLGSTSIDFKKEVLKGLFDSECSFDERSRAISFAVKDWKIASLVQDSLREVLNIETKMKLEKNGTYRLRIYGIANFRKFSSDIGFTIKRKQEQMDTYLAKHEEEER